MKVLHDYYQYAGSLPDFRLHGKLNGANGFFRLGEEVICYGQLAHLDGLRGSAKNPPDVLPAIGHESPLAFPFDPGRVVENLRLERYLSGQKHHSMRSVYYNIRPLLPDSLRRRLQRTYLRSWRSIAFPAWPVDTSVEKLMERLLLLLLQSGGMERIPFIWFWPEGRNSCVMMTHDVETRSGRDLCRLQMDVDDSFHIKSSFQIVPEQRYEISADFFQQFRDRGFEIGVQGLNHDGRLFCSREEFLRRAVKINHYGKKFEAHGFRSPVMYRNPDWFDALEFSYDMSMPNVAHLEAQRGGCCTVMPYFIGDILELPLTTTQDYSLFHILKDYSIDLWKEQIRIIAANHGLITFIIHPDYAMACPKSRRTYEDLLEHLGGLRSERNLWIALPREVDRWWRQRCAMQLVPKGSGWAIEGPGSASARLAYAVLDGNRLRYKIED